jgi:hypothetical protein
MANSSPTPHPTHARRPTAGTGTNGNAVHVATCPNCRRLDQVRAVPAVRHAGIQITQVQLRHHDVAGYGGRITGSATSMTPLARALAPPAAPRTPTAATIVLVLTGFFLLVLLQSRPNVQSLIDVLPGVLLLAAIDALCGLVISRRLRARRVHGPVAARALELWQASWYCGRCGIAYLPGTKPVAATTLTAYLLTWARADIVASQMRPETEAGRNLSGGYSR